MLLAICVLCEELETNSHGSVFNFLACFLWIQPHVAKSHHAQSLRAEFSIQYYSGENRFLLAAAVQKDSITCAYNLKYRQHCIVYAFWSIHRKLHNVQIIWNEVKWTLNVSPQYQISSSANWGFNICNWGFNICNYAYHLVQYDSICNYAYYLVQFDSLCISFGAIWFNMQLCISFSAIWFNMHIIPCNLIQYAYNLVQ